MKKSKNMNKGKRALQALTATAVAGALLASPAMASIPAGAVVDSATKIYYNDVQLDTEQPVINKDGRVLLAFRDLFENLDGDVNWDAEKRIASVTYGKTTINLMPDNGAAQINGVPQALDVGPQIINDRVYLPLRFVAQSLGGTVDYTQNNGVGEVQIHTIDSVQNFAQQNGNITKILRTTTAPASSIAVNKNNQEAYQNWLDNSSVYFLDDHDNLIEVQSYDNNIQVNVINYQDAKVTSSTHETDVVFPALTNVVKNGKTYTITINGTESTRYLGVGEPASYNYRDVLDTTYGDMAVYNGSATEKQVVFDASADKAVVTSAVNTGTVLDMAQLNGTQNYTSYAVADNGTAAYMMNGHLLIVNSDDDILEDVTLSRSVSYSKVFTTGDKFVAVLIEKGGSYPELYAAVYEADGDMVRNLHNISRISKVEEDETFYSYNNLQVHDIVVSNDVLYVLAKTDMDYYLVQFDTDDYTSSKEMLSLKEPNYDGFIYTMDDVMLFAADENYFYLRELN